MYFLKLNQLATQKLLEIIAGTFQSVYINVADRYRVLSTKCRRHSLVTYMIILRVFGCFIKNRIFVHSPVEHA